MLLPLPATSGNCAWTVAVLLTPVTATRTFLRARHHPHHPPILAVAVLTALQTGRGCVYLPVLLNPAAPFPPAPPPPQPLNRTFAAADGGTTRALPATPRHRTLHPTLPPTPRVAPVLALTILHAPPFFGLPTVTVSGGGPIPLARPHPHPTPWWCVLPASHARRQLPRTRPIYCRRLVAPHPTCPVPCRHAVGGLDGVYLDYQCLLTPWMPPPPSPGRRRKEEGEILCLG